MTDERKTTAAEDQTGAEVAKLKRQSLKEIARRVSSVPPMSARPQLDSMRPVSVSNRPPAPSAHPAFNELAKLCEAAETRPEARLSPTMPIAAPTPKPSRPSALLPVLGGVGVAAVAISLSLFVFTRTSQPPARAAIDPAQPVVAAAAQPADVAADPVAVQRAPAAPVAVAPAAEREPTTAQLAHEPSAALAGTKSEPAPKTGTAQTASNNASAKEPAADGDLSSAMASAVGAGGSAKQDGASTADAPAAGSVPLTPSQGQVQSALANVRGAARGCVAGMEGASRATVTFGSNGRVSGVSVDGPASGKPAAACISAALRDARVPAFQKPSFSVGLTLRP